VDISQILQNYDLNDITIGVLGGHSALDVCRGTKKHRFKNVVVCQKGREKVYDKYYKSRNGKGCVDDVIIVDKFSDIVNPEVQEELRRRNTIFIHNRYFWVYCDFDEIENNFKVPIYGSRTLLKLEERDIVNNQYYLLEEGGIRIPILYVVPELKFEDGLVSFTKTPEQEMVGLTLTKANNAIRTYERENFTASSWHDWLSIAQKKVKDGLITFEALQKCVVEEFILGAQINYNFFYSVLNDELELMGTDTRRQTNLDGVLRLPAQEQLKIPHLTKFIKHIETGHISVTCKESLLRKAFDAGEKFVVSCKNNANQDMIGPFALQGAIDTRDNKEELVVFDVSMRIPGSPGTRFTPYSGYLYGESISYGERIGMEIQQALSTNQIHRIVT